MCFVEVSRDSHLANQSSHFGLNISHIVWKDGHHGLRIIQRDRLAPHMAFATKSDTVGFPDASRGQFDFMRGLASFQLRPITTFRHRYVCASAGLGKPNIRDVKASSDGFNRLGPDKIVQFLTRELWHK
jgi:hypothetical protein